MAESTLLQIRSKIKLDCSLEEEKFVTDAELNSYINEAIRNVEAEIHGLYEDYYLSTANIALVSGTSAYSLPADIYANKIRKVIYDDGGTKYDIHRIRDLSITPYIDTGANYSYLLTNTAAAGVKLKLYPTSRETSSTNVTVWYIRLSKELTSDSHTCDIPTSFLNYVYWHVKLAVFQKEASPQIVEAQREVDTLKQKMIETLQNRIPDDDNMIMMSTEFYQDME